MTIIFPKQIHILEREGKRESGKEREREGEREESERDTQKEGQKDFFYLFLPHLSLSKICFRK